MRVVASHEVGTYVRERGGGLYVWLEDVGRESGMLKVSTSAPPREIEWERADAGSFELLLDPQLPRPEEVRVRLSRFPWKRVSVAGFDAGGAAGAAEGAARRVLWGSAGGGDGGDGGGGGGAGDGSG